MSIKKIAVLFVLALAFLMFVASCVSNEGELKESPFAYETDSLYTMERLEQDILDYLGTVEILDVQVSETASLISAVAIIKRTYENMSEMGIFVVTQKGIGFVNLNSATKTYDYIPQSLTVDYNSNEAVVYVVDSSTDYEYIYTIAVSENEDNGVHLDISMQAK